MHIWVTRSLATVGAAAILVVGFDYATYAATGSSLLMGRTNSASKVTIIKNTGAGSAVSLLTKSAASAPFTTNAKGRVVNLNADKVDGLTASQILTASHTTKAIIYTDPLTSHASSTTFTVGKVPAGTYAIAMNAAVNLSTGGNFPTTYNLMRCWLHVSGSPFEIGEGTDYSLDSGGFVTPSFATIGTFTGAETLLLDCYSNTDDGWASGGDKSVTLSFVKLDGATNKVLP